MYNFLLTVHVLACLLLILIVLLQAGRGAGLAVFGPSGDTVFASPSGSSFLKQFTAVLAGTFALTSLMLTLLSGRVGMRSVTQRQVQLPVTQPQGAPAPAAKPAPESAPRAAAPVELEKAAPAPAGKKK